MIASRSFAAPALAPDGEALEAAPPTFPLLPFAYMAYVEHCSQDYAHYVDALAHADKKPVAAEDALGLHMLSDMNQAFFSLVWAPFGAAMNRAQL